jgi:hypothetical protein
MLARTLLSTVLVVALAAPLAAPVASGAPPAATAAAKKKCKKGFVKRKGKCVKRKKTPAPPVAPAAPTPPAAPTAPAAPVTPAAPATPSNGLPANGSPEAAALFTQLLSGSALKRVTASTGAYSSTQSNTTYSFCASGTLRYYSEYIGTVSSSITRWSGTWKVDTAGYSPDGNIGEAIISYTTDGSADAPPPGRTIVRIQAKGPAYMGSSASDALEYSYVKGGASC